MRPLLSCFGLRARSLGGTGGLGGARSLGSTRSCRSSRSTFGTRNRLFAVEVRGEVALAERALLELDASHHLNGFPAIRAFHRAAAASIGWSKAHNFLLLNAGKMALPECLV